MNSAQNGCPIKGQSQRGIEAASVTKPAGTVPRGVIQLRFTAHLLLMRFCPGRALRPGIVLKLRREPRSSHE